MSTSLFQTQRRIYLAAIPHNDQLPLLSQIASSVKEELVAKCPSLAEKIETTTESDLHLTLVEPISQVLDDEEEPWRSKIAQLAKSYPELKCEQDDPWVLLSEPTLCISINPANKHIRTLRYQLKPTDRFLSLRDTLYRTLFKEGQRPQMDDTSGLQRLSAGGHITLLKFSRLTDAENAIVANLLGTSNSPLAPAASSSSQIEELKIEEGSARDAAPSPIKVNNRVQFPSDSPLASLQPITFLPELKLGIVHIRTSFTPFNERTSSSNQRK